MNANGNSKPFTYEYDSAQDMLYILFETVNSSTFYEDAADIPGVMLRYTTGDERIVGITVHHVAAQLKIDSPTDSALRQLAHDLIRKLQPVLA